MTSRVPPLFHPLPATDTEYPHKAPDALSSSLLFLSILKVKRKDFSSIPVPLKMAEEEDTKN